MMPKQSVPPSMGVKIPDETTKINAIIFSLAAEIFHIQHYSG